MRERGRTYGVLFRDHSPIGGFCAIAWSRKDGETIAILSDEQIRAREDHEPFGKAAFADAAKDMKGAGPIESFSYGNTV
jgi:hypothetical protein